MRVRVHKIYFVNFNNAYNKALQKISSIINSLFDLDGVNYPYCHQP